MCQDQALSALSRELRSLLEPSDLQVLRDFSDNKQVPEKWRYRCEAFSILLSLSKIDPHQQPPEITELVSHNQNKKEKLLKG